MLPKANREAIVSTPRHRLRIDCYYGFISVDKVETDKTLFSDMCRSGCKNFNGKYCCPPNSPDFLSCIRGYGSLLVLMFMIDLNQLSEYGYKDYHRLRIGNAVIKPRIEKVMRSLERDIGGRFLGTGACRLCKPCRRKIGEPCKYPDKMRFSLESVGVDCDKLTRELFNIPLLWYKDRKAPEYTAVMCALPIKEIKDKEWVCELINKRIDESVI